MRIIMTDNHIQDGDYSENELSKIFKRRQSLNDAIAKGENVEPTFKKHTSKNVYVEFQEFTRKEIKEFERKFKM